MDPQNIQAGGLVGRGYLNLAVQAARAEQGGVQDVGAVGGHHHLHRAQRLKPVQLVQQLHQGTLDLSVCGCALRETTSSNGIHLVHENDAGLVVLGVPEHLANHAGRLANVLVHNRRSHHLEESGVDVGCQRPCQQRLPRPRGPVEEHALGRLDAHAVEQLGVGQGQLDHLAKLSDLLVEPANLGEADAVLVLVEHVVDARVHLTGQLAHDGEGGHVQGHTRARFKLRLVQLAAAAHHVAGPAGGLDNEALLVQLLQHVPNDLAHTLKSF
mmetsp:Transcript_21570/g.31297  ORF Transcript_21570/g.31297 Transcript_21570/m.31297 type:complete len:270 (-) Transcript_21570:196-1005(-)